MTAPAPLRIAAWSGPRNLSTALMRAFENRPDCAVIDEPFYAAYLQATGLQHPLRDEVLKSQPTDWRQVAASLLGPVPQNRAIFYQKHMTHHMLPQFDRDWMQHAANAFLIRDPSQVLASYVKSRETVTLADIGFVQQAELFDRAYETLGRAPPVIDAADLRANPEQTLRALCAALAIPFTPAMLHWPPGPRATDGVWAPAWYASVERSTGFARDAPSNPAPNLPPPLRAVADEAEPYYQKLHAHRLASTASAGA